MDADQSTAEHAVESVLVVDDSALQRMHTVELCHTMNITNILEAGDGEHGLAVLASLPALPQVVIVDLAMPGMDGVEFLQQLVERQLRVSVIVASGKEAALISSVETMINALGLPILGAVQKPLTAEKLLTALRRFHVETEGDATAVPLAPTIVVADLAVGIFRHQIIPYYQPKVDLRTGVIKSVEVLARWLHPELGMISPAQFIPMAEQHGLIHGLTLSIAEQALAEVSQWQAKGLRLSTAINLSPRLLPDPHFIEDIASVVARSGVDAQRVTWEITESSVMGDVGAALYTLARLRLKGFGLSIDDYGTGFSSMQQLSRVPFTELKIDQSFVTGAQEKPHLKVILQSAIEMAQKLDLSTVAEGVESLEDWQLLQQMGCELAQGYFIAKPMPASELPLWLRDSAPRLRQLHI